MIRRILGALFVIAGVGIGAYVGLWLFFRAGIHQIAQGIRGPAGLDLASIAWGVLKLFLGAVAGWISSVALLLPGFSIFSGGTKRGGPFKT